MTFTLQPVPASLDKAGIGKGGNPIGVPQTDHQCEFAIYLTKYFIAAKFCRVDNSRGLGRQKSQWYSESSSHRYHWEAKGAGRGKRLIPLIFVHEWRIERPEPDRCIRRKQCGKAEWHGSDLSDPAEQWVLAFQRCKYVLCVVGRLAVLSIWYGNIGMNLTC